MVAPNYDGQLLLFCETETQFRAGVRKISKEQGMALTTALHHNGIYLFVASEGTGWALNAVSSVWHPDRVLENQLGRNGAFVTSLVKTESVWEGHLSSGSGITGQRIAALESWPELQEHIAEEWDAGRVITDMVNHGDRFYVVTSGGLDWGQAWYLDPAYPEQKLMRASAEEGMVITDVMRVEDQYLWVCSSETGHTMNYVETAPTEEFVEMITDVLMDPSGFRGYRLALIREVGGRPCFIFAR